MSQLGRYVSVSAAGVSSVTAGTGINLTGSAANPIINLDVPVTIANGGTNAITMATTYGVNYFDGTSLVTTSVGTAAQVLTSNGVGVAPTFQAAPAGTIDITGDTGGALTGSSFTFTGGTTGLSFGGAGTTETLTFAGITANAGAINLGTDNAANAIKIGLGTVARTIDIGFSAASHIIRIGVASGTASVNIQSGSGGATLNSVGGTAQLSGSTGTTVTSAAGPVDIDGNTSVSINSVGGAINIGNDADSFDINIGTAGTRTINLGSGTATIDIGGFAEGALVTSSAGAVSTVTGTAGYILTANAAGTAPSFQAVAASSVSITGDTGGALTGDSFTFTGGTTGLSFGGAGTTETLSGTLIVSNGGTGVTSNTAYAVLCGGTTSTNPVQSIASVGSSGEVLTSNGAGALPTFQAAAVSFTWAVTTVNASIVVNNGYIANKAGLLTMTLPATGAIGDLIEITGINTAVGWRIAQNASQQIFFGTSSTAVGVGGYIEATNIRDSVKLVCVVAGASTVWNVISSVGNITIA